MDTKRSNLPKEIFLKEYDFITQQIQDINNWTLRYMTIYLTFTTSYFAYVAAGIYLLGYKSKDIVLNSALRGSMLVYGLLGIMLTLFKSILFFYGLREIADSRKHKIRYWRALHFLRKNMLDIEDNANNPFLLPSDLYVKRENGDKILVPNVGGGNKFSFFILIIYNAISLTILHMFIAVSVLGMKYDDIVFSWRLYWHAFIIFLPFLLGALLLSFSMLKHFYVKTKEANLITFKCSHPNFYEHFYSQVKQHRYKKTIGKSGTWVVMLLISWISFWYAFYEKLYDEQIFSAWIYVGSMTCLFFICQLLYYYNINRIYQIEECDK
ncbi:hypothetical protein GF336_00730 [Candidatus Woesearchaeota archaeon]|nr:hypothetical protein [Candidatus Woesearchaeota archaeon]